MSRASIIGGGAQIVNGGKEIIFDDSFADAKRVRNLAGGFNVKIGFIGQHTTKHRNIDGHTIVTQQCSLFFRRRTFFFRQTVCQRFYRLKLSRADMHQLLGVRVR